MSWSGWFDMEFTMKEKDIQVFFLQLGKNCELKGKNWRV